MAVTLGVVIKPRDLSCRVNGSGICEAEETGSAGIGRVKLGDLAVRISEEAMPEEIGAKILPRDLPDRIDGEGTRPPEITRRYVGSRGIKRCDSTVEVPHK